MKNQFQINPMDEARFFILYEAECKRKENLLEEFEKLERIERQRKKTDNLVFKKKYERVTRGLFSVKDITGEFVLLVGEKDKELGMLHVNPEISKLLKVNDEIEGTFGFRDGYWRIHFLFCISSSTDDFMPEIS